MALGRNAKVDLIRKVPLFGQLSRAEVNEVAKIADEIDVKAGKVLTREGDRGNEFFVLLDGAAEVHRGGRKVRMLGAGDFFGEIALVSRSPRTATVTTTVPHRPARDHGDELPRAPRPLAADPAARARGARRPAGADRRLGAQLGAEALGQRCHDALAQRRGVLVGERALGRLEREPERDRLPALPHLLAAVDVEDARLAQLGPAASFAAATSAPASTSSGTATARSWRSAGNVITSSYSTRSGAAVDERRRGRARRRPTSPRAAAGWSSPTMPAGVPRRLARVEERARLALALERRARRAARRGAPPPRPWRAGSRRRTMPADAPALLGQLLAARQVHAGDLEERDPLGARVELDLGRLDEARQQRRPQDRLIRRHRIGQPDRARDRGSPGREAPGVRLVEAGADEHVLDEPAQALLLRQPAAHVPPQRQRERHPVEDGARDLLDDVDLARDVARTPARDRARPSRRRRRTAAGRGCSRCSASATSRPSTAFVRAGRRRMTGRSGSSRGDVGRAGELGARELDDQLARVDGGRLGQRAGRRPSPSGSTPRSAGRAAPRCAGS